MGTYKIAYKAIIEGIQLQPNYVQQKVAIIEGIQ